MLPCWKPPIALLVAACLNKQQDHSQVNKESRERKRKEGRTYDTRER